jgi:hypothetical protein
LRVAEKIMLEYKVICGLQWAPQVQETEFGFRVGDVDVQFNAEFGESRAEQLMRATRRVWATATSRRSLKESSKLAGLLRPFEKGLLPNDYVVSAAEHDGSEYARDIAAGSLPQGLILPASTFPAFYGEFLDSLRAPMLRAIDSAFALLRQRCGDPSQPRTDDGRIVLRLDEGEWFVPPQSGSMRRGIGRTLTYVDLNAVKDVQRMLDGGDDLDVAGHGLFSEAFNAVFMHPRAGFLVAYVALETSLKRFLSSEVPESRWLLAELPSPPVFKLIEHMAVPIADRKGFKDEARALMGLVKQVHNLTTLRNELVHGRQPVLQLEAAKRHIVLMETVFWTLKCSRRSGSEQPLHGPLRSGLCIHGATAERPDKPAPLNAELELGCREYSDVVPAPVRAFGSQRERVGRTAEKVALMVTYDHRVLAPRQGYRFSLPLHRDLGGCG